MKDKTMSRREQEIQLYLYERDARINDPRAVNSYKSTPPGTPTQLTKVRKEKKQR